MSTKLMSISDSNFEWIDITSPTEDELLDIGKKYNIHPYSIRDCLEPDHLPKYEVQEGYHFIISRLVLEEISNLKVHTIQQATSKVAIFFSDSFILTIHRLPLTFMEEIKVKYILNHKCHQPSDVVVRILWNVLHTYEQPANKIANELDILEEKIFLKNLPPLMIQNLYFLKRKSHIAVKLLQMSTSIVQGISSTDKIASDDLKDLHMKLSTIFSQNLDDAHALLNFYLSISSQKTNEVMRILTVFSAFFLPLTFIAGVYGMNFKYMPELSHPYGYISVWIVMIIVTIIIYQWFWRKKWL